MLLESNYLCVSQQKGKSSKVKHFKDSIISRLNFLCYIYTYILIYNFKCQQFNNALLPPKLNGLFVREFGTHAAMTVAICISKNPVFNPGRDETCNGDQR